MKRWFVCNVFRVSRRQHQLNVPLIHLSRHSGRRSPRWTDV